MLYGLMVLFAVTGARASPVAFTRVVNGWFAKNRGLALGLALMSTGIAAATTAQASPRFDQNQTQ